ncbi:hypothetical protein GCM10023350_03920 [Nocardioides endophyticus]|uniref:Uncharacterized protein n=1 Tax=Nocardioides endophyticus TaxID=1353775 RepID=A0ABP8Y9G7_9ACTN
MWPRDHDSYDVSGEDLDGVARLGPVDDDGGDRTVDLDPDGQDGSFTSGAPTRCRCASSW